jgi:hypothetical protein
MTFNTKMMGSFISSQRAEGAAMTRTDFPHVTILAGALALIATIIALPLWW